MTVGQRLDDAEAVARMTRAGFEPMEPYPGATAKWLCRCVGCGKEFRRALGGVRRSGGRGCKSCAHRGDPARALTEMRAVGLEPASPYPGSQKPWRSECVRCGRTVAPALASIRSGLTSGCRYCGHVARAARQIAASEAEARSIMLAAGLVPLTPYPGSTTPWRCVCEMCGRTVTPTKGNVMNGHGCAYCARQQRARQDGIPIVYLLRHAAAGAVKVGVTAMVNGRMPRITQHATRGWVAVLVYHAASHIEAYEAERAVVNHWRASGVGIGMPVGTDGYTETAPESDVDLAAVMAMISGGE